MPISLTSRKVLVSLGVIALLLSVSLGLGALMMVLKPKPQRRESDDRIVVRCQQLEYQTVQEILFGYGTARPILEADISAEVTGRIIKVRDGLRAGVWVRKGEILCRLDPKEYGEELKRREGMKEQRLADVNRIQVELEHANANLKVAEEDILLAKAERSRIEKLVESGDASKSEMNRALLNLQTYTKNHIQAQRQQELLGPARQQLMAQLKVDEAEIEKARLNVQRTEIVAPFDAQVRVIDCEVGEVVGRNQILMSLVSLQEIEVPVELPGSRVNDVPPGSKAVLEVEGSLSSKWEGTVERVSPVIDEMNRTFSAYVRVDNAKYDALLRPGTFLTSRIEGPVYEDVLVVPRGAFVGDSIYILKDGKAQRRTPEVLRTFSDLRILGEGVEPGELVILTNLDQIYEGSAVQTLDELPATGSGRGISPAMIGQITVE